MQRLERALNSVWAGIAALGLTYGSVAHNNYMRYQYNEPLQPYTVLILGYITIMYYGAPTPRAVTFTAKGLICESSKYYELIEEQLHGSRHSGRYFSQLFSWGRRCGRTMRER